MASALQGSVTVATLALLLRYFASASPWTSALVANSDPSVAMSRCLYMASPQLLRGAPERSRAFDVNLCYAAPQLPALTPINCFAQRLRPLPARAGEGRNC